MGILDTSQDLELSEGRDKSIILPSFSWRHLARNKLETFHYLPFAQIAHKNYQVLLLYLCSFLISFPKEN